MNSSRFGPADQRIGELARWQGGHVTRKQLAELGLDDNAVLYRVRAGRLIRVHHGVFAVGHLPATPQDRAHGALLAAGPRSALAARTALALWLNERTWPEKIELISTRDTRPRGVSVRHAKSLLNRDLRSVQGLRVTSPARTALDLAALTRKDELTKRDLTRIVNDLRHVNKLKLHELRDVTARNPRHLGTGPLLGLIGEGQRQPTRSELENAFLRLCRRHKLPTPQVNRQLGGIEVDAYFPDHALIVELDGREVTHAEDWRPAFEADRARVVDVMARTGIPTIRFTWNQITKLHRDTASKLRAILDARGPRASDG